MFIPQVSPQQMGIGKLNVQDGALGMEGDDFSVTPSGQRDSAQGALLPRAGLGDSSEVMAGELVFYNKSIK